MIESSGPKQIRPVAPPSGVADVLFTPVQQRVLGLIFGQPDRQFQSAQLIRLAGAGTGAVHRFLIRLAQADLVTVHNIGNQKHYQANAKSPVFNELTGLVRKTVGIVAPLSAALAPLMGAIVAAFVFGSLAKGGERAESDVDLMVISDDLDYAALYRVLPAAETALARPINPTVMDRDQWRRKRAESGSFAARIAAQPRLFVLGTEDDLD